jgi:hypothetical protein
MTAAAQEPCPSGFDLLERWLDYRDAWIAAHDAPVDAGQPVRSTQ